MNSSGELSSCVISSSILIFIHVWSGAYLALGNEAIVLSSYCLNHGNFLELGNSGKIGIFLFY